MLNIGPQKYIESNWILTYVMQSKGINLKSNMWHFQFSNWLKCSFGEVQFVENPTWIRPVVPKLWATEGFSNNRTQKSSVHFLTISHNRCSQLLTDSAKSQHIFENYLSLGSINNIFPEKTITYINLDRIKWWIKHGLNFFKFTNKYMEVLPFNTGYKYLHLRTKHTCSESLYKLPVSCVIKVLYSLTLTENIYIPWNLVVWTTLTLKISKYSDTICSFNNLTCLGQRKYISEACSTYKWKHLETVREVSQKLTCISSTSEIFNSMA